jgi:hypothetical protein
MFNNIHPEQLISNAAWITTLGYISGQLILADTS